MRNLNLLYLIYRIVLKKCGAMLKWNLALFLNERWILAVEVLLYFLNGAHFIETKRLITCILFFKKCQSQLFLVLPWLLDLLDIDVRLGVLQWLVDTAEKLYISIILNIFNFLRFLSPLNSYSFCGILRWFPLARKITFIYLNRPFV